MRKSPLEGGSFKSIFLNPFRFLTHPYPSRGGDYVLLLGVYPFEFGLSMTAMGSTPRPTGFNRYAVNSSMLVDGYKP
ncbi:hypothetical protein [uncultured Acetobacteroides sp.]|uniref:hypothetical protein n=1 Tax=uncultured Acetobacteroides sp. TaxID=1760811 RepID=UPI002AA8C283|nr:hypothetical protein [uncultured Acetobacteroides sp.]